MLDYWKLWVHNRSIIDSIIAKTLRRGTIELNLDENRKITWTYSHWKLSLVPSAYRLQISGSIHKYFNDGTNETDFSLLDAQRAIKMFCMELDLPPELAQVKNLEFGVNLIPKLLASKMVGLAICYNYTVPSFPYGPKSYFLEFNQSRCYIKLYDKHKQLKSIKPDVKNILRFETKLMTARSLARLGIVTLEDLLNSNNLIQLGRCLVEKSHKLIFDDDTIDLTQLSIREKDLYLRYSNPRTWQNLKGKTTSKTRSQIKRYKDILEKHGSLDIYKYFKQLVQEKIKELSTID